MRVEFGLSLKSFRSARRSLLKVSSRFFSLRTRTRAERTIEIPVIQIDKEQKADEEEEDPFQAILKMHSETQRLHTAELVVLGSSQSSLRKLSHSPALSRSRSGSPKQHSIVNVNHATCPASLSSMTDQVDHRSKSDTTIVALQP